MPTRTKSKVKKKLQLTAAEKIRRLRKIQGLFPKNAVPDPIKWVRAGRRDRKVI